MLLEQGGSIHGSVLNDAPDAPARFALYVVTASQGETVGHVIDCDRYTIHLPPWEFERARAPRWAVSNRGVAQSDLLPSWEAPTGTIWYPGTTNWDSAGVVTIVDHSAVSGIEISLPSE